MKLKQDSVCAGIYRDFCRARIFHRVGFLDASILPPEGKGVWATVSKGFTLVELLVAIAVIAILASLLLPGLSRAKQTANNVVCLNNLRQQGIALIMYVGDNGAYPPYAVPQLPQSVKYWVHFLEPYVADKWPNSSDTKFSNGGSVSNHGVFACPGYDSCNRKHRQN